MNKFRECGDCTACCTWLIGDAHGHSFGCGKSCNFLKSSGCGIYDTRPETCKKYQCAWSQHLIKENLRPDKCNVLISVETDEVGQYLKVIPINNKKIDNDVKQYLIDWGEKMNTRVLFLL